jgi:hypothetical protein
MCELLFTLSQCAVLGVVILVFFSVIHSLKQVLCSCKLLSLHLCGVGKYVPVVHANMVVGDIRLVSFQHHNNGLLWGGGGH